MKKVLILVIGSGLLGPSAFAGVGLGTAETFAVLGASTVTNTGATLIRGNLGVGPGTAITGFPPGIMLKGSMYAGDSVAMQAQADLTTAYNAVAALPCTTNLTGQDLGGLTLTPGVYCFNTSAQLTGTLTLDFQGNNKATFNFQMGSTLTTASSSAVAMKNCTLHCVVNWQVGSSATLGTSTAFSGNIMALASITLNTNVHLCGRALAQTGAVTLDTNDVYFRGTLTPPALVTGTGQIAVPRPDSSDPDASGAGIATFALISDPNTKGAYLDYFNQATGRRIYGLIDDAAVLTTFPDGSAKMILLSGSCHESLPACSFSATVEKGSNGNPGRFGVSVAGRVSENRSPRPTAGAMLFQ